MIGGHHGTSRPTQLGNIRRQRQPLVIPDSADRQQDVGDAIFHGDLKQDPQAAA
jgi:hypothetical protein